MLQGFAGPESSTESLLTVGEVAERLGVSKATVYKLCDRRELEHIRVSNAIRVQPHSLRLLVEGVTRGRTR